MFKFDEIAKAATAALGALLLTTTVVGAAVGPAHALDQTPAAIATLAPAGLLDA